jgi:hypothetical protein
MKIQRNEVYKNLKKDCKERLKTIPVISQKLIVDKAYQCASVLRGRQRLMSFWLNILDNLNIIEPLYKDIK